MPLQRHVVHGEPEHVVEGILLGHGVEDQASTEGNVRGKHVGTVRMVPVKGGAWFNVLTVVCVCVCFL